ncbi:MAG: hypothetical protein KAH33_04570 [Candidatus Delongbacteria bacterium]|nr:hypothetical protein [Candidatus Delongbacteria bacterium]
MKKLTAFFLLALLSLTMLVQTGCDSSREDDESASVVIGIEVSSPTDNTNFIIGAPILVTAKLTGYTSDYSEVNYYFGNAETTPITTFDKDQLDSLASVQEQDAEFQWAVSTKNLSGTEANLIVEAVGNNLSNEAVTIPLTLTTPAALNFTILSPAQNQEFNIGDRITFEVEMHGELSLFDEFNAYIGSSTSPFYSSNTAESVITFDLATDDLYEAAYLLKFELTTKDEEVTSQNFSFSLIEYIPTFEALGTAGYELKSIIQTYDNGYLTVASNPASGTIVTKYNKEGVELWNTTSTGNSIPASIGIAESICEDTEYDKGYVIAGWIQNGGVKDTWVRKINQTDGGLIWNKHYGFDWCDDGATVIKKSIDDGYIVGGYTLNPYGTDSLIIDYEIDGLPATVRTTWETGYDGRLLKIYSNGNEVWGHNVAYVGHKMWHDITLHKLDDVLWVRKMGDQYITDLVAKEDGNYMVTGWNNWKLYYTVGIEKKDMFFAEYDVFGGYVSSLTWSRISAFDAENFAGDDDPYAGILNVEIVNANHIGDLTEDEIGNSLVESQGGWGGQVVMAGETHQTDAKAKLDDAWIAEFGINADEDGALWEYSFGEAGANANDKAYGIDQTKDGGYIITGYNTGSDLSTDTWLFKLDAKLSLVWSKTISTAGDDTGVKVVQTKDGGFVIGGNVGNRARIIKVDKAGDSTAK